MPGASTAGRALAMSADELALLRQGVLEFDRAAYWTEMAQGLWAPSPPLEGPLGVHNGHGWLLAVGDLRQRLRRPVSPAWRLSGNVWMIGAAIATNWVSPAVPVAVALGAAASVSMLLGLRANRGHRRFKRRLRDVVPLPVVDGGAHDPRRLVKLEGTVAPGPTIPSLFGGVPCVLSRNAQGWADELRGLDFTLLLDDGQRVAVSARDAHLMNPPVAITGPPACGPVTASRDLIEGPVRLISTLHHQPTTWPRPRRPREVTVAPGDRVEVTGFLNQEVSPDGTAAPGRQTPLRPILRSGPDAPLLVRRL